MQDVSELRRQLDESLEAVAANSGLEAPGLLDREADRLQETLGRYSGGADYSRVNRWVLGYWWLMCAIVRSHFKIDS